MIEQRKLIDPEYLAFPFRMSAAGPEVSRRKKHVAEKIKQVLLTNPGERVYRPTFGAGVRNLVFEPGAEGFKETLEKSLAASLREALQGEVDPRTLVVDITKEDERLIIAISYFLATIGIQETHSYTVSEGGDIG